MPGSRLSLGRGLLANTGDPKRPCKCLAELSNGDHHVARQASVLPTAFQTRILYHVCLKNTKIPKMVWFSFGLPQNTKQHPSVSAPLVRLEEGQQKCRVVLRGVLAWKTYRLQIGVKSLQLAKCSIPVGFSRKIVATPPTQKKGKERGTPETKTYHSHSSKTQLLDDILVNHGKLLSTRSGNRTK